MYGCWSALVQGSLLRSSSMCWLIRCVIIRTGMPTNMGSQWVEGAPLGNRGRARGAHLRITLPAGSTRVRALAPCLQARVDAPHYLQGLNRIRFMIGVSEWLPHRVSGSSRQLLTPSAPRIVPTRYCYARHTGRELQGET